VPTQTIGASDKLIRQAVKERESRRAGRSRTIAVPKQHIFPLYRSLDIAAHCFGVSSLELTSLRS